MADVIEGGWWRRRRGKRWKRRRRGFLLPIHVQADVGLGDGRHEGATALPDRLELLDGLRERNKQRNNEKTVKTL